MTLTVSLATPDDEALDSFTSGVSEVDRYFRTREWFNHERGKASPPTYRFSLPNSDEMVGFAAVAFRRLPYPSDISGEVRLFLVIYVIGVDARYQGCRDPEEPGHSIAESMFQHVLKLASERIECLGVSLWVRTDNPKAIAFYRKVGFVPDPGGPKARDAGAPHLTMRLLISAHGTP